MAGDKKVIKLFNGPLHGMEWPGDEREHIDLLENSTGKVRRYRRSDTAMFVKEWASKEEYDKEVHPDHLAGPGQQRQIDPSSTPGSKERRDP